MDMNHESDANPNFFNKRDFYYVRERELEVNDNEFRHQIQLQIHPLSFELGRLSQVVL